MIPLDIVGLGLSTRDALLQLRDMPTWGQAGMLSAFGFDGGGPARTAYVTAARLGARVGFIGTAGNDHLADLKLRSLAENGVDLSHLVRRGRPEAQVAVVYVSEETGERVFSELKGLSEAPLRAAELDRGYIISAQYVRLDGFHGEAALQATRCLRGAGKQVSIDCALTDGRPMAP